MRVLPLALLLGLVTAAPAAADSLVYVKDSNVWSAHPDGSQQRRLTSGGTPQNPYSSPSQADDGTIVAVRGTRLRKLDAPKATGSGSQQPPAGPGAGAPPFDADVIVRSSARRRAVLRRGLTVKVHCGVACSVVAVAKARGRRVAKARTSGAGALRAKLKPRRRAIARARSLALTVRIHVTGAPTKTVKRSVRLR